MSLCSVHEHFVTYLVYFVLFVENVISNDK